MEEYGRIATEEIYRQWGKGINPAVYMGVKYYNWKSYFMAISNFLKVK